MRRTQKSRPIGVYALVFTGGVALALTPLQAQDASTAQDPDYLDALRSCQQIVDDTARLDCFDAAVGNIVTASDAGDVQVVDREDVRETRRSLFGFQLPDLGIFGGDDDDEEEDELFTTTIERCALSLVTKSPIHDR